MFGRGAKAKQEKPLIVDVFVGNENAEEFKRYVASRRIDESQALAEVLERGIGNYWLLEFKRLKENYRNVEPMFIEYKKDNETLNKLYEENEKLRKILGQHPATGTPTRSSCSNSEVDSA